MSIRPTVWGCILVALVLSAACSSADVKPGDAMPPLALEVMLNAPEAAKADWESLRGRVVVLEFWATWCGPCVAAIPHMNELTTKLKEEPITFISITDEDRAKIERFLKKKPIAGWVGLDTDQALQKALNVRAIPATFIVDKQGRLVQRTHPNAVTESMLRKVLKDAPVEPTPEPAPAAEPAAEVKPKPEPEPLVQMLIRPAANPLLGGSSSGHGMLKLTTYTRDSILAQAFDKPIHLMDIRLPADQTRYDVIVRLPESQSARVRPLLRELVEMTFAAVAQAETREVDALVLRAAEGGLKLPDTAVEEGGSSTNTSDKMLQTVNTPLSALSDYLGSAAKMAVFDETGASGRYDFELHWSGGVDGLIQELRDRHGIAAAREKRSVEFMVVRPAKADSE